MDWFARGDWRLPPTPIERELIQAIRWLYTGIEYVPIMGLFVSNHSRAQPASILYAAYRQLRTHSGSPMRDNPMKPVPTELIELCKEGRASCSRGHASTGPMNTKTITSPWWPRYHDPEKACQLEGHPIDAVMDYDTAHGTFTPCPV